MIKKRPDGLAWEAFIRNWRSASHVEKLALAAQHEVTYDVAKHWISESGNAHPQLERTPIGTISAEELLGNRPCVNLDFVCFDIETSNLQADFSVLMTACIKPFGQPSRVFRADDYSFWAENRACDKPIVYDIADELRKHAVVIGHFSSGFDIPFLRAKMVKYGIEPLPSMFGIDSWRIAKNNFKVSSRRLKNLSEFFDIGDKEPVEGGLWMQAAYNGSPEAMDKIVAHNIKDVEILERLACLSFPYLKSIPRL